MLLTLDASVVCKWYLDPVDEPDWELARAVAAALMRDSNIGIVQPPHWIAEVVAVTTRLRPLDCPRIVDALIRIQAPVLDTAAAYDLAVTIATETGQHVFDSLYHAVACLSGGVLITADARYYSAAADRGSILHLKDAASLLAAGEP